MLYSLAGMPVVYVIGEDWTLRAGVRAELRERGVEALGMETSADASAALAAGQTPSAIVLDANSKAASDPTLQKLVGRVPSVVVASRTSSVRLGSATKTLFRPVQIRAIVTAVVDLLKGQTT
ncbi:MAG TPA: hypothetical protein VGR94_10925 [Candidatus Acidoferrales bacterium]|nr:hypothetical protein [Candidatus Acidoferrales bacterium]